MSQSKLPINLNRINALIKIPTCSALIIAAFLLGAAVFYNFQITAAQTVVKTQALPPTPFRIGERLTYNVSFANLNNVAYAETHVISRGKLGEKDAVELFSKIKTNELVSAFYLIDESRTTFAAAESGLPLYVRKTDNAQITPKETISNYTVNQTAFNDLLTVIYQARNAGGSGTFAFQEDDKSYSAVFLNTGKNEKFKNTIGEFETSVSTVESNFLTERGIKNLKINFTTDEEKIPVLIRFSTAKGAFRAEIASIQMTEPEVSVVPTPTPINTPRPQNTPRPIVTPTPYIENLPLSKDLPFVLGETLEYQITNSGQMIGMITLQAKERRQFAGQDSLLLTATATGTQPNQQIFRLNDTIRAQVNPESIATQQIELRLSGGMSQFNQQLAFNQTNGLVVTNKGNQIEIPVGTHSILSLAYAVRSFNLKPSKDLSNPVNDTRVAVFLDAKSYVFTLRPAPASILNLRGETVAAQLITINTGNPAIDLYNMRLWLSNDEKRLPLRFTFGTYQADLISEKIIEPQKNKYEEKNER